MLLCCARYGWITAKLTGFTIKFSSQLKSLPSFSTRLRPSLCEPSVHKVRSYQTHTFCGNATPIQISPEWRWFMAIDCSFHVNLPSHQHWLSIVLWHGGVFLPPPHPILSHHDMMIKKKKILPLPFWPFDVKKKEALKIDFTYTHTQKLS